MVIGFKFHFFEIEDNVGHVLDHTRKRGELMLRPRDFCGRDGRAFQRGKQDASERISDSVAIAGFEWLGNELGVSICGCVLVFDESFRHFKTTVTDWHIL